ncbi:MAG: tRNA lysidine(34) synthetase TilS, partial [Calditrichaeota bacterium]|nr:tRNA lysidine(34) synthetase TilS [Calditrichota bacterium]
LDMLHRMAPQVDCQCVVGHVDHGLRPESAADAEFVFDLARRYGLPVCSRKVDVHLFMRAEKLSQEAAARRLRYRALEEMASEANCEFILTAHTADDSAETFLLRFIQSPDWWEWTAIPMRRGNILRPLISVRRQFLHDYAVRHGLRWCEDSTNRDMRFPRNYLRWKALPSLARQGGSVDIPALARAGASIRDIVEDLLKEAEEFVMEAKAQNGKMVLAIGEILLYFTMIPWAPVERAAAALTGNPGLRWPAWRRRQVAEFVSAKTPKALLGVGQDVWLIRHGERLAVTCGLPKSVSHSLRGVGRHRIEAMGELNISILPNNGALNRENCIRVRAELAAGGLLLRTWQPGDRLNIFRRGRRKVADLLSEMHADPASRMSALVLCDEEGPFWLIGHGSDQRVRPLPSDELIAELEWKPNKLPN